MTLPSEQPMKYWAFISYSSSDSHAARALHRSIETYGIPSALVSHKTPSGEPTPKRFRPIFRDRDELPASADLGAEIEGALTASRYLIVLCSPKAAASEWVDREIRMFQSLGREKEVLAVILSGEPRSGDSRECFPPSLRESQPIAADLRPQGDGALNAKLKLLSGMLGVGFDALKQRDAQRRTRRLQITSAVLFVLVLAFATLGIYSNYQRLEAIEARQRETQRAQELEQVARFQANQLSDVRPASMGNRMRQNLTKQIDVIVARQGGSREQAAARQDMLSSALQGINFTDTAADWLQWGIFDRSLDAIERSFTDQPQVKARLLNSTGFTMRRVGLKKQATEPLRDALSIFQKELGPDHPRTVTVLGNLGLLLHETGESEEGLNLLRESLAHLRAMPQEKDEHYKQNFSNGLSTLGTVLTELGHYEEANTILHEGLAYADANFGRKSIEYVVLTGNLGLLQLVQDRLPEAESLLVSAQEIASDMGIQDHPELIHIDNNLAQLRHRQGKFDQASDISSESITTQAHLLGDDHPDSMYSAIATAVMIFEQQGDFEKSIMMLENILQRALQQHGSNHRITLLAQANLGAIYLKAPMLELAEPLLVAAYNGRHALYGDNHIETLSALSKLAALRLAQLDHQNAYELYTQAAPQSEELMGPDHVQTIEILNGQGAALMALNQLDKADSIFAECIQRLARSGRSEHYIHYTILQNRGFVAMQRGDLDTALDLSRAALRGLTRILGPANDTTELAAINVACILELRGETAASRAAFHEIVDLRKPLFAEQPDIRPIVLNQLGVELLDQDYYIGADVFLAEAFRYALDTFGRVHDQTLIIQYNYAFTLLNLGRLTEAEQLIRDAIQAIHAVYPNDPTQALEWEYNLATFLLDQKRWNEAEGVLRTMLKIHETNEYPEGVNATKYLLTWTLIRQSKFIEAEEIALSTYGFFSDQYGAADEQTVEIIAQLIELYETWSATEETGHAKKQTEYWKNLTIQSP